jgi:hypothetical protein
LTIIRLIGVVALAVASLGGCALGPVSPQQRAAAASDVTVTQPRPRPVLAGVPLDGSFNKLYCTNDGPNTICSRQ